MKLRKTIQFLILAFCFLACDCNVFAQYAKRISPLPTLPASCNPLNGEVVWLTTGAGISPGLYTCTATNTWRLAGLAGNSLAVAQGTLTANTPFINQTATWNNGAVVFTNILTNITDTASNAGSLLLSLQVGGNPQFSVNKSGFTSTTGGMSIGGSIAIAAAGNFSFTGSTMMASSANGQLNYTNAAGTDFVSVTYGPESVTNPRIARSAAVAGQTQGIIILRGDGTPQVQASLGAATNGSIIYCSDCTIANPCAGGGTGAIAKRLNGAWVCN